MSDGAVGVLIFVGIMVTIPVVGFTGACYMDDKILWIVRWREARTHRHEMKMLALRARWKREREVLEYATKDGDT